MEDCQGPEFLQVVLARAKLPVPPYPVDVQVAQCQQFSDRDCKTHHRVGQRPRDRVESTRGGSEPFAAFATGTRCPGVHSARCQPRQPPTSTWKWLRSKPSWLQRKPIGMLFVQNHGRRCVTQMWEGFQGVFIPPMPCLVPAELDNWMKERHADR